MKWMAVECLQKYEFSQASEVLVPWFSHHFHFHFSWAFGVFLWEMWSLGQVPYSNIENEDMLVHLEAGNRLRKPKAASEEM